MKDDKKPEESVNSGENHVQDVIAQVKVTETPDSNPFIIKSLKPPVVNSIDTD